MLRRPPAALLALLLALAAAPAVADIVTLATGARIEGKVVYEDEEVVKVETKTGVQTFYRDDVVKIERIADPKAEFERRRKALEAVRKSDLATAKAWYDLGVWADERELKPEAKVAFERTIAIDPDHAGARHKLGFERIGREWLPHDEAQRRKGLVEHEGRWVKPEEKEKLEQGYVLDINGEWIKKEVLEERAREAAERRRKQRDYEKEQARLARDKEKEKAEREGRPPPAEDEGGQDAAPEAGDARPEGKPEFPTPDTLQRMLDRQKADARAAEQFIGVRFLDLEDGPLLVHTTHAKESEKLARTLRDLVALYKAESKIYNLGIDDPIWPGKLQIYFFKDKSEFDAFATRVDDAPGAVNSGGYFIHGGGSGGDTKLHIAMYDLDLGTLAHEMSHAFMSRYQLSPRVVAPWVNEGVAEFLRLYVSETMKMGQREYRHRGLVREMLARADDRVSLKVLMEKEDIAGTEGWAYAVSYTVIDFMVALDPGKGTRFVKFLKLVKRGDGTFRDRWSGAGPAEQAAAIEQAFGTTVEKFESGWKEYVRAYR